MPSNDISALSKFNLDKVFGQIKLSSGLKDMIYVIALIVMLALLLAMFKVSAWIIILAFILLIGIIIFFAYCYNYLMHNNPDLLRSESFQLQKQRIEMLGEKGKEMPAETIIEKKAIEQLPKKT
jgi:phosphoglycerol transferase MdoB-like AlkP superfamily enzyme